MLNLPCKHIYHILTPERIYNQLRLGPELDVCPPSACPSTLAKRAQPGGSSQPPSVEKTRLQDGGPPGARFESVN